MKVTGKKQLPLLLTTHNLSHTDNFATRIQNNSITNIDNIFVDNSSLNLSFISPTIKSVSDHNVQILTIKVYVQK